MGAAVMVGLILWLLLRSSEDDDSGENSENDTCSVVALDTIVFQPLSEQVTAYNSSTLIPLIIDDSKTTMDMCGYSMQNGTLIVDTPGSYEWQFDMYQDNPGASGEIDIFLYVNDVARQSVKGSLTELNFSVTNTISLASGDKLYWMLHNDWNTAGRPPASILVKGGMLTLNTPVT